MKTASYDRGSNRLLCQHLNRIRKKRVHCREHASKRGTDKAMKTWCSRRILTLVLDIFSKVNIQKSYGLIASKLLSFGEVKHAQFLDFGTSKTLPTALPVSVCLIENNL